MISKLQNRALRTINFADLNDDPNPLYKRDDILKINDLVKLKNVLFVYDFLHNSLPACFNEEFVKLANVYTSVRTRSAETGEKNYRIWPAINLPAMHCYLEYIHGIV